MTSFADAASVADLGEAFLARTLPKARWTHEGHFAAALHVIRNRPDIDPAHDMPGLIRAYNLATGGVNTTTAGYHETITQASLLAARALLLTRPPSEALHLSLAALMASRLGDKEWPLDLWSRERLFAPEARARWIDPDLAPLTELPRRLALAPRDLTASVDLGVTRLTRDAIIAFATSYDPQPWHLTDEAARATHFGALCASGWHTLAVIDRLLTERLTAFSPAPRLRRIQELRWTRPLFVDEAVRLRFAFAEAPTGGPVAGRADLTALGPDGAPGETKAILIGEWGTEPATEDPTPEIDPATPFRDPDAGPIYWEDVALHQARRYGDLTVTEADVAEFARDYGGSVGAADATVPPPLVLSLWMRMTVAQSIGRANPTSMGSPGPRDVRFPSPVRVGDRLTCRSVPIERVALKSRADLGLILSRNEVTNQDGQVVLRFIGQLLIRRRG